MSRDELEKMKALDEAAEKAGGYLAKATNKDTHYNYRKIAEYCKSKGIEPLDLTIRELNTFIVS